MSRLHGGFPFCPGQRPSLKGHPNPRSRGPTTGVPSQPVILTIFPAESFSGDVHHTAPLLELLIHGMPPALKQDLR